MEAAWYDDSGQNMLEVLRAVFAQRIPYEPEQDFQTSHYVLGVTSNVRLDDWEDGEDGPPKEWFGWSIRAVGDDVPWVYVFTSSTPLRYHSTLSGCERMALIRCLTASIATCGK